MSYEVKDLQVLSPVDHVRLRKSMYIGESLDPSPLFNEIIDNALDEQNAGYSPLTKVEVDYQNNIYKVTDFGRGFPQGKIKNPETGKETEALELLCTTAFSGGKFGNSAYKLSCFTGDTKIRLADGRDLEIQELIKEFESGKDNFSYSVDNKSGKFLIEKINDVRVAKYVKEICEVTLDNGEVIRCTPDHRFLLRDLSLKHAQDLTSEDSLLAGYFKKSNGNEYFVREGYDMIYDQSLGKFIPCHYLADDYNLRNQVYTWKGKGLCRHHKDLNKTNNNPTNIVQMSWADHRKEHGSQPLIQYNQSEKGRETSRRIGLTVGKQNLLNYVYSEENRRDKSYRMTKMNSDPEIQKKQQAWFHTEEGKKLMSERTKKLNADPEHQRKCMEGKVLKIASKILSDGKEINEDSWNEYRFKNLPRFNKAISIIGSYDLLVEKAKLYNHKVVSVKIISLDEEIPVYDITIREGANNFLLSSGVFVKNSGLHGVGLLVTNSLSKSYITKTWRDGQLIEYSAQQGRTKSLIYNNISEGTPSGTEVIFSPDPEIFSETKIPLSHILMRCKVASAFGMKNVLKVRKEDSDEFEEISTESDIFDLLPEEDEGISEYYRHSFDVFDPDTGEHASVALKYTSDTKEYSRGYTNLLYNSQGGSHIKMLDSAVYDAWAHFNVPDIKWNDIYLGLRGVISVFITHTEFSSQSKERLTVNKIQLDKLKSLITQEIIKWLTDNEEIRLSLIKRFQEYRVSQDKLLARKEIKSLLYVNNSKGGQVRRSSVVRKLRDCDSKSKEGTELFIIEGDSACFTGDTEVRLSNNQTLTFEELVSLNLSEINVYSLDIPRSNFISTKASDIRITRLTNRIIKIGLSDSSFIKCTVDHLFYNSILKDWVRADSLVIGDSLLSADNLQVSHKTITSIENIEYESSIPVYCMTVEGTHNFMLANGLIVHNCGSGLSARNTRTQALLPVRGKVFNVARCADPKEALSNEETRSIINAIGAGIMDQADPDKSRYERIIFMTDSDFDGCFTGDTVIKSLDGNSYSFEELVSKGINELWVYSKDESGNIVPALARNPRITKYVDELVELTFDNDYKVRCTPDHPILLNSGEYIEAKDLTAEDSISSIYFRMTPPHGYIKAPYLECSNGGSFIRVHHIVNWSCSNKFKELSDLVSANPDNFAGQRTPIVVHHKDHNIYNNCPDNLEAMLNSDHARLHYVEYNKSKEKWEKLRDRRLNDPEYDLWYRNRVSQSFLDYNSSQEHSDKVSEMNRDSRIRALQLLGKAASVISKLNYDQVQITESNYNNYLKCKSLSFYPKWSEIPELLEGTTHQTLNEFIKKSFDHFPHSGKTVSIDYNQKAKSMIAVALRKCDEYTEENYERVRKQFNLKSVPKWINILNYFDSYEEAFEYAKTYNHRIKGISKIKLDHSIPVYDLTVDSYHNFMIETSDDHMEGIIVHNCEIAVLLSGLFINLLAPLVKAGMIYVALPPLYGWEDKDGLHFANKLSEIPEKILLSKNFSRYKGLGEMSTNELWDSTMNPDTRRLIRLNYPEDVGMFNSILTSSGVKYQMLVDQGVIKEDN